MNKLLAGIVLSTFIATAAHAGDKEREYHKKGNFMPMHKIERVLDLTDEQKTKLQALKEEIKAERRSNREEGKGRGRDEHTKLMRDLNPNDPDYQEKVNAMANEKAEKAKSRFLKHAEIQMKVAEILTEEQMDKLEKMKSKRSEKHHKNH